MLNNVGMPAQQRMRKEGLLWRLAPFRLPLTDMYIPGKGNDLHEVSMSKLEEFQARARELAGSSNFYGWPPLEFELRFEDGYSDAREWLYLPSTRDELDRICEAARKRREAA